MTTTKNTTIPTTSLSIAQSIAKIETEAEFKAFMVATFKYDKKLSPSQIVREYSAKTGFEVKDTDDFKSVLSNIAKDSDINTSPETLPNVEQKDINTQPEAKVETPNAEGGEKDDEKKYLDKIECIKGKLKLRPVGDELTNLAIEFSPLFARLKKGEKLTNIEIASELYPVFDTLQISIVLNCHKGGIEKSLKDKGLYTGVREKSEGTGEVSDKSKKAKEAAEAKAKELAELHAKEAAERAAYFASAKGMRETLDAKINFIAQLSDEVKDDEKAYTLQVEKEANDAKEAAKQTLSNNVANMKNAGLSVDDMLAQIEAMKAMIEAMNA
jgi:hypothetical protein